MIIVEVVFAAVDSVVVVLVRAVAIHHIVDVLVAVIVFVDFVDESAQSADDFVVQIADFVVAAVLFVVVTLQHVYLSHYVYYYHRGLYVSTYTRHKGRAKKKKIPVI